MVVTLAQLQKESVSIARAYNRTIWICPWIPVAIAAPAGTIPRKRCPQVVYSDALCNREIQSCILIDRPVFVLGNWIQKPASTATVQIAWEMARIRSSAIAFDGTVQACPAAIAFAESIESAHTMKAAGCVDTARARNVASRSAPTVCTSA